MSSRNASIKILNTFFSSNNSKTSLKHIIDSFFIRNHFSSSDRRFIFDMVKGTIRHLLKIDYIIDVFSNIKLDKIDFRILIILRLSVFQLLHMDRIPPYAVLNESVKITKRTSGLYSSKFVNAVLRKINEEKELENFINSNLNDRCKDKLEKISILHSFPLWIINYWNETYNKEEIERICKSLNEKTYNFIRVNNLKFSKKSLLENHLKDIAIDPSEFMECSSKDIEFKFFYNNILNGNTCLLDDVLILKSIQDLNELESFSKGFFSIQDYSSQIAVKFFLKPEKKEKILDLCGAPGGKASYMSELTNGESEIISVDINKYRLKLFNDNVKRLGIKNIKIMEEDVNRKNFLNKGGKYIDYFDKIFVDPPCSAFGTTYKNPDVKYNKKRDDIKRLSSLSLNMLRNCKDYLKQGGFIVFYTCTISREENQNVIYRFLDENSSEFKLEQISGKDFFEIMPYYFKSEAGFLAILKKK